MYHRQRSKARPLCNAQSVFSAAMKTAYLCLLVLALVINNGWAQPTVPSLIAIFTNPNNNRQSSLNALNALDRTDQDWSQTFGALIKVLGGNQYNVDVRKRALERLIELVELNPDPTDASKMLRAEEDLRLLQRHNVVGVLAGVLHTPDGGAPSGLDLRVAAVQAIGSIGDALGMDKGKDDARENIRNALRQAVNPLSGVLIAGGNDNLRIEVVDAFQKMGPEAKDAIPTLVPILMNSGVTFGIREPIFNALVKINLKLPVSDSTLPIAVQAFQEVLENRADLLDARTEAAATLGLIGPAAKNDVPIKRALAVLTRVLKNDGEREEVLSAAVGSVNQLVRDAKKTRDELNTDAQVRGIDPEDYDKRIKAISELTKEADRVSSALIEVLESSRANEDLRKTIMVILVALDPETKDAIEAVRFLKEKAMTIRERSQATKTIVWLARSLARRDEKGSVPMLMEAKEAIKDSGGDPNEVTQATKEIQDTIDILNKGKCGFICQIIEWLLIVVRIFALPVFVSLMLLWLRPLWLWHINESLKNVKLPETVQILNPVVAFVSTLFAFVLIVGLFHYHRRVLDAWVAKYIDRALERFSARDTVRDRDFYVPVPVVCDGEPVEGELGPQHLRPLFSDNRVCLLICGEGGAGKTSLACQLGKWAMSRDKPLCEDHAMLPVLIEKNLDPAAKNGEDGFFKAICGGLQGLIGAQYPLSEKLLDHLLRRKRVLVIVDGLSELDEATRKQIVPLSPSFAANALIVTSRSERELETVNKTTIRPLWIEGGKLSSFLQGYLDKRGEKAKFNDKEFYAACEGLTEMVGTGKVTPLIGKFYADMMIEFKRKEKEGVLPKTIPDLMLDYVEQQNRKVKDVAISDDLVRLFAKVIALECLAKTYKPTAAYVKGVIAAIVIEWESIKSDRPAAVREWLALRSNVLASLDRQDVTEKMADDFVADYIVEYFINRLGLLRKDDPERIRFSHDPLAEYLAGLYLIEHFRDDERKWREFIAGAETVAGGTETIKGFLLAVRDCVRLKGAEVGVPAFVPAEIDKLVSPNVGAQPEPGQASDIVEHTAP